MMHCTMDDLLALRAGPRFHPQIWHLPDLFPPDGPGGGNSRRGESELVIL